MFEDFKVFETEVAGRKLSIETGKMAQLANGAVLVRYGETNVLCTATMSDKPREGVDFFPLSVDFEEKLYSVGKIPGSFQRREGKASEKAVDELDKMSEANGEVSDKEDNSSEEKESEE